MAEKKIIAVAGATGAQGGGLARAILNDSSSDFAVRALTRDPGSDKAKELASLGAEVVQADLHDAAAVDRAFAGAYGAFCVTFFWAHMSTETELAEARNMAEAAKKARLQHVVWSTLEDTRKWVPLSDDRMPSIGQYKVPHFDAKGEADAFFATSGVPTTYLLASFYWDNMIGFGSGPKRGPDGKLTLSLPMGNAKLAGIAADDIGKCAYGIFRRGPSMAGQRTGIAGEHLTGEEMAEKLSRALGEEVKYQPVPFDVFRSLDIPAADDLGNMFQFYTEFANVVLGTRDVAQSRELNPELQSFDEWLAQNKDRIPLD